MAHWHRERRCHCRSDYVVANDTHTHTHAQPSDNQSIKGQEERLSQSENYGNSEDAKDDEELGSLAYIA